MDFNSSSELKKQDFFVRKWTLEGTAKNGRIRSCRAEVQMDQRRRVDAGWVLPAGQEVKAGDAADWSTVAERIGAKLPRRNENR